MTTTFSKTLARTLDEADPNKIADALRQVKLGTMLSPLKSVISQIASADVILDPPALYVMDATVTGGAATSGPRHVASDAATPGAPGATGPGIATLSDDGKTLSFDGNVTDAVIMYMPRSTVDLTSAFPSTGNG